MSLRIPPARAGNYHCQTNCLWPSFRGGRLSNVCCAEVRSIGGVDKSIHGNQKVSDSNPGASESYNVGVHSKTAAMIPSHLPAAIATR